MLQIFLNEVSQNYIFIFNVITNIVKYLSITEFGNEIIHYKIQIANKNEIMEEFKTERIKQLVAAKIKETKGETTYAEIAEKCNTSAAKVSNAANDKIDCRLSTFIEIATGLRIHPKDLFDIMFDFSSYYADLDGALRNDKVNKK